MTSIETLVQTARLITEATDPREVLRLARVVGDKAHEYTTTFAKRGNAPLPRATPDQLFLSAQNAWTGTFLLTARTALNDALGEMAEQVGTPLSVTLYRTTDEVRGYVEREVRDDFTVTLVDGVVVDLNDVLALAF